MGYCAQMNSKILQFFFFVCEIAKQRIAETNLPMINVHLVGGQDALVFDGQLHICDLVFPSCFR